MTASYCYEIKAQVNPDAPVYSEVRDMIDQTLTLSGTEGTELAMRVQAVIDGYLAELETAASSLL